MEGLPQPVFGAPPEAPVPIATLGLDQGAQDRVKGGAAAERSEGTLDAAEHPGTPHCDGGRGPARPAGLRLSPVAVVQVRSGSGRGIEEGGEPGIGLGAGGLCLGG